MIYQLDLIGTAVFATASLVGGVMFVVLAHFHAPQSLLIPLPAATVLAVRLAAIYWQLSLPVFDDEYPEDRKLPALWPPAPHPLRGSSCCSSGFCRTDFASGCPVFCA